MFSYFRGFDPRMTLQALESACQAMIHAAEPTAKVLTIPLVSSQNASTFANSNYFLKY